MHNISNKVKEALKHNVREIRGYIKFDDNIIYNANDLEEIKISCESSLFKSAMKKVEIQLSNVYNIVDKMVEVGFGVKVDEEYQYIKLGMFKIEKNTISELNKTVLVGYDLMKDTMINYRSLDADYTNMNLKKYIELIGETLQIEIISNECINLNKMVKEDLFKNISKVTYRDIIEQIAEATATTALITPDNKLYFKTIKQTNEILTPHNLISRKIEKKFGKINSVVLSRTPQEDNFFKRDEEAILQNGLNEWRIENNEFIDKERPKWINELYNALYGLSFYPFETKTIGLGYLEICDALNMNLENGEPLYNILILGYTITINSGLRETLYCKAPNSTTTKYNYATNVEKRLKLAEIIVDKQKQEITNIVKDNDDKTKKITEIYQNLSVIKSQIRDVEEETTKINNIANDNTNIKDNVEIIKGIISTLTQELDKIQSKFEKIGGNNYIKDSAFLGYSKEGINSKIWLTKKNSTNSIVKTEIKGNSEVISNNALLLNNSYIYQIVNIERKNEYTFSLKVNKDRAGTGKIKVFEKQENTTIEDTLKTIPYLIYNLENGEQYNFDLLEFEELKFNTNKIIILLESVEENVYFADLMLNVGKKAQEWTQHSR